MRTTISSFQAPKAGSSLLECEDAYGIGPPPIGVGHFAGQRLRVAVADGASEAVLAARWATELVKHFALAPHRRGLNGVLDAAIGAWGDSVAEYINERESNQLPLQWYEEPGIERGAYATIVALRLTDHYATHSLEGDFDAWALGDSCLFNIRDDSVIA